MPQPPSLATRLAAGLEALRLDVSAPAHARLLAYLELLVEWNRAYNLTAVREPAEMLTRHLLDSLAVLPYLAGRRLADLGSGAGLPGIPLAIARPELAVTLVESNGKKARFLREAVRSLPLPGVRVAEQRVQDLAGTFDTITARAFASLTDMLAWGGHLLHGEGRWLALKGRIDKAEIDAVPAEFRVVAVHPLVVPGVEGQRCVVELRHAPAPEPRAAMIG